MATPDQILPGDEYEKRSLAGCRVALAENDMAGWVRRLEFFKKTRPPKGQRFLLVQQLLLQEGLSQPYQWLKACLDILGLEGKDEDLDLMGTCLKQKHDGLLPLLYDRHFLFDTSYKARAAQGADNLREMCCALLEGRWPHIETVMPYFVSNMASRRETHLLKGLLLKEWKHAKAGTRLTMIDRLGAMDPGPAPEMIRFSEAMAEVMIREPAHWKRLRLEPDGAAVVGRLIQLRWLPEVPLPIGPYTIEHREALKDFFREAVAAAEYLTIRDNTPPALGGSQTVTRL